MRANEPHEGNQRTVLSIIRDLKSCRASGSSLATDDRRRCVEHMTAEGYTTAEVADVLGVCERTVARDPKGIREANAIQRDPALAPENGGPAVPAAESGIARLKRIGSDKDAAAPARVDAEQAAWTIPRELVETLQNLGYLPTAATEIRSQVTHALEGGTSELAAELMRMELIVQASNDPALVVQLEQTRALVTAAQAEDQVVALQQKLLDSGGGGDDQG